MVDVVVRLHGPTDQAPKLRHLRVLAHVQLDDDPRTPIQQSVGDEFRQHDGVVTMMMFYRRRASPKHRYGIIEVDYGGGEAPHTAKRSQGSIVVSLGCPPAPVYKGAREEEAVPRRGRTKCGVLLGLPSPSRIPPPIWNRTRGREKEKEGRGRPPSLVQFGPDQGEGCGHP